MGSLLISALCALGQVRESDEPVETLKTMGRSLLEQGDYGGAYRALLKAFREVPGDREINSWLGQAAFAKGDFEAAVMAFERELILAPGSAPAKLGLARSYFKLGVNETAKVYFEELLGENPPAEIRRICLAHLEDIRVGERAGVFGGRLSLGIGWDSNVRASPQDTSQTFAAGQLDFPSRDTDYLFMTVLDVDHRYRFRERGLDWKTDGTLFSSRAGHEDQQYDPSNIDFREISAGTGPSFGDGRTWFLDLQCFGEQWDKGHDLYRRAMGVRGTYSGTFSESFFLRLDGVFSDNDYYQAPKRDSLSGSLALSPGYYWGATRLSARILVAAEDATGDGLGEEDFHSYEKIAARLSATRPIPVKFRLPFINCFGMRWLVEYEREYVDYREPHAILGSRRDDIDRYRVMLRAHINPDLDQWVDVTYRYSDARSTAGAYEYTRNFTSIEYSISF